MKSIHLLVTAWATLICAQARADNCWWFECNGDWFDCGAWSCGCPTCGDVVYIDDGCGGPLINSNACAGTIYCGSDTSGNSLDLSGPSATLTASGLYLGEALGSDCVLSLNSGAQLQVSGSAYYIEYVGYQGNGTVLQGAGTTHTISKNLVLGGESGAIGTYELEDNALLNAQNIWIGEYGTGSLQQMGGVVDLGIYTLIIGHRAGSEGTYELHAPGILNASAVRLAGQGTSTVIQNGGTITLTGYLAVHETPGDGSCTYHMNSGELFISGDLRLWNYVPQGNGSSSFLQTGGMVIVGNLLDMNDDVNYELSGTGMLSSVKQELGYRGTGIMVQSGGSNEIADHLWIGHEGRCYGLPGINPGVGLYELSGTGELSVGGEEIIGTDFGNSPCSDSRGDFIQSGGVHTVQSFLYVGYTPNITGTYTISGGELSAFRLWVGYQGNGEFTQTGGVVSTDRMDLGREPGSSGTYTLSEGGELLVEDRLTVGRGGSGVLTLGGGTLAAEFLHVGKFSGLASVDIADASAEVAVGQEFTLGGNASLTAVPGSVIHLTHSADGTTSAKFDNLSTSPFSLIGLRNLELSFEGGADLISTIEVGGVDLGGVESGFVGNCSIGTLRVGTPQTPAHVRLLDDRENAASGGESEAQYVHMIALSEGSTLDVNGLHVYTHYVCDAGGTIELHGGSIQQITSALPGDLDHNGQVDFDDFSSFADCMAGPETTPAPQSVECTQACLDTFDLDEDGDVDARDFNVFQLNFTG